MYKYKCMCVCVSSICCVLHEPRRFLRAGRGSFPVKLAGITRAAFAPAPELMLSDCVLKASVFFPDGLFCSWCAFGLSKQAAGNIPKSLLASEANVANAGTFACFFHLSLNFWGGWEGSGARHYDGQCGQTGREKHIFLRLESDTSPSRSLQERQQRGRAAGSAPSSAPGRAQPRRLEGQLRSHSQIAPSCG